jgi:beta-aspartyl-peptidase (threonine type)
MQVQHNAKVIAAGCLLLASAMTALAVPGERTEPSGKADIKRLLDDQVVAWNKGDLPGFMVGYWKSEELSFYSAGTKTKGWQATLARYQKRYQAEGKEMGKLTFSELDIEMLGAENAFVRGRWKLILSKESPGGLFTLIVKKLPEGWRIIHDHTSSEQ